MGPTTAALLRFFTTDQAFVEARHKLEAATKNVRVQQAKVTQLQAEHDALHTSAITAEAKGREVEGDLNAREARITLLRDRQTNATNPKEYQALIVEINTQKLDKSKLEEQALTHMDQAATHKKGVVELKAKLDAEVAKHVQMSSEIDQRVKDLTAEMEALRGPRDAAAAALPHGVRAAYDRASERYDGEAMAAIEKPDPRDQEYLCTGCNTYLVADIYNRLRSSKDEIVTCPSCQRVLYIPTDLTPELALSKKPVRGDKPVKAKKEKKPVDPNAPKKERTPRVKKVKGPPAEPGSIAAALAAGAASASGKGPKDVTQAKAAPLPSTADGRTNFGDDEAANDEPATNVESGGVIEADAGESSVESDAVQTAADANPAHE